MWLFHALSGLGAPVTLTNQITSSMCYYCIVFCLVCLACFITLSLQDGETPLYIASLNGHTSVVALLLENKADPYISSAHEVG